MTVDHSLGSCTSVTSILFFIIGGLEATDHRIQFAHPSQPFVSPQTFDHLFTMHGTTIILLVGIPLLLGSPMLCRAT